MDNINSHRLKCLRREATEPSQALSVNAQAMRADANMLLFRDAARRLPYKTGLSCIPFT